MGMYQFNLAGDYSGKQYIKLTPEKSVGYAFNLGRAASTSRMVAWSIQAMASANIRVTAWVSNFLHRPFDANTENREWKVPKLNMGGLWMPCNSISGFTIRAGENYFQQGEFKETVQFLMFNFTAEYPEASKHLLDASGLPVDEVALSFVANFK